MQALIIGYGSIGARHAGLLEAMGYSLECVTGNPDCPYQSPVTIAEALKESAPDIAIICNATANHLSSLNELIECEYAGPILVEKPLFDSSRNAPAPLNTVKVAYNLRFHPLVTRTKELLKGQKTLNAQFHVGQYLPEWRPGTDYRDSYSAKRNAGGGVLRDLSHELDLTSFLLGRWKRVAALGGKVSDLEIDSDDQFTLLLQTADCPAVSVHMDYSSRTTRRGFTITTTEMTIVADFVAGTLAFGDTVENHTIKRDDTYRLQLQAMRTSHQSLCSYQQGLDTIRLIEAAENSALSQKWISAQ